MDKREYQKQEIERIGQALDLENPTRELADIMVQTVDIAGACNGRAAEEVIGGCIYIAIRNRSEPVSLRDLSQVVAVRMSDIVDAYNEIVDEFSILLEPPSPYKFVDEFVANLNAEYDSNLGEDVGTTAKELIQNSWGSGFSSGSTPTGIAAGAVYIASQKEGFRVTQGEVAKVANVSPKTVRNNAHTHRAFCEDEN